MKWNIYWIYESNMFVELFIPNNFENREFGYSSKQKYLGT